MPKQEMQINQLQTFLPDGSFPDVLYYLQTYKVHLTISRSRASILGDYRHAMPGKAHRISVNGNLNKYSFLITLLHELAHLFTYEKFGHRVKAHGQEWKNEFGKILAKFLLQKVFPADIEKALLRTLQNPAASSCGDENLLRVLHQYDEKILGTQLLEQIADGSVFMIKGGRVFKKGERIRKRYKCMEIKTEKLYLFSPVFEVLPLND